MEDFTSMEPLEEWTSLDPVGAEQEPEAIIEIPQEQEIILDPEIPAEENNSIFTSIPEMPAEEMTINQEIPQEAGADPSEELEIIQENLLLELPTPTPLPVLDLEEQQLQVLREIRDRLDGSSEVTTEEAVLITEEIESETESTTDYVKAIYDEVKAQNDKIAGIESSVQIIAHDNQLIGRLTVGTSVMIVGALVVWFFLGRIR